MQFENIRKEKEKREGNMERKEIKMNKLMKSKNPYFKK
jgi:hypothetical protein